MKRSMLAISSICAISHACAHSFPTMFLNKDRADHYWHAFLLQANGNKAEAQKIADSIKNGDPLITPQSYEEQPSLENIGNSYFISQFSHSPQSLSDIGIFESIGLKEHNAFLDEVSPAHIKKIHVLQKEILERLDNLNTAHEKIDYLFLQWIRKNLEEKTPFLFHEYRITQMFGILQNLISVFTRYHVLEEPRDFELYIERLKKIPAQIEQTIELIAYQKRLNIVPPRFAVKKVINLVDKLMPRDSKDHIFYTHFEKQLRELNLKNTPEHLEQVKTILEFDIYPTLRTLKQHCSELLLVSHMNGVWALPDGDAYYQYCLKRHTTTTLSADEIHTLGCKQIQEIRQSIHTILASIGESVSDENLAMRLNSIMKQPRFHYKNNDEGREHCLSDLRETWQRSRKHLYPLFSAHPKKLLQIKAVPKEFQEGKPLAYYSAPSVDGKRAGVFYINLRDMDEISKCQLESLVLHEAEPGHHFQDTLQLEMDLPIIRKYTDFSAHSEGWGLYCERLGYEQKFYSDVYQELGYLQWELLRASRLVVDTGIHYKRWSYEQAIEYMVNTTGLERANVITEVERYFIMPGQACSYKVGQLTLLELRDIMKNSLQKHFTIQKFHDLVLNMGPMPLSLLENLILKIIGEKTEASQN